ncbi:MAG: hypothetical protein QME47_07915, partial [Candidatus Thermoplasmatota archaeon]|nr:hypothetical protein [Candidatus Thermoplasmatota archaeon]
MEMDRWLENKGAATQKTVTASEVGTFAFCPLTFYLTRKFGVIQTERMKEGGYLHSPLILALT